MITPDSLEKRSITTKDGRSYNFNFLVIDSPEKWQEASNFHSVYRMPMPGDRQFMSFDLRGLSLAEYEQIEINHKLPTPDSQEETTSPEYIEKRVLLEAAKRANLIEVSTGKKLPGDDFLAKGKALMGLNDGEVRALTLHIQNHCCALADGRLLTSYIDISNDRSDNLDKVTEFTGLEAWQKATETCYIFRMQRPLDDYILEFPLRNLTAEKKLFIEIETRDPEPPKVPKRDPVTRRWIPNELVPDYNDAGYQARSRAVNQKRLILYLSSCLSFDIPGVSQQEQYEWVSRRLLGDVIRLKEYIEDELCGYKSRYDAFTGV